MVPSDQQIREMAEARVGFRRHATAFVIVNLFFAGLWYMQTKGDGFYWPLWSHLGWGMGLAFHGASAYGCGAGAVEREEQKLRKKYGR
jgi:hypothetical protein